MPTNLEIKTLPQITRTTLSSATSSPLSSSLSSTSPSSSSSPSSASPSASATSSSSSSSSERNQISLNGNRPISVYDNYLDNLTNSNGINSLNKIMCDFNGTTVSSISIQESQFDGSPTQAHCLMTTVPQNIAAQNIANKHTPTRNSLRHSRMIAMNKTGRVHRKYLPTIIRYNKLAKALMGLATLIGSALCFLALWLLVWTPNIRQRDNPHWSGIPVILSGIIGLILMCCCRKEYPGNKKSYCVYSIKVLSITLSTIAAVAALTASVFALIHLLSIYTMTCLPPDKLDSTCVCRLEQNNNNQTSLPIKSYHYIDLSCPEVKNILTILIIFSCASNLLAGIIEIWYIYLHWASRYVYVYSKVRTDDSNQTVFKRT